MGVAELAPTSYDKTSFRTSQSQLSKLVSPSSTRLSNHSSLRYHYLPRPTKSRIQCSLAPKKKRQNHGRN